MIFNFPDSDLDSLGAIKLIKVLSRGNFILYHIEGYPEFLIEYTKSINKAILTRDKLVNHEPLLQNIWAPKLKRKINLEKEIDYLPEDIRDFIIFNLDLFS
jgi:hypothetical protein